MFESPKRKYNVVIWSPIVGYGQLDLLNEPITQITFNQDFMIISSFDNSTLKTICTIQGRLNSIIGPRQSSALGST